MLELAEFSRSAMGLGVVLVLMVVVFWLLRRFGPQAVGRAGGGGRRLTLVETLPLDPRTRLVLVRHDEREHLIVVSSSGAATFLNAPGVTAAEAMPTARTGGGDAS